MDDCYGGRVNFVGHAMVARWQRSEPAFVLGAMLPDLARMCDAKAPPTDDAAITAGMKLHHRTDAVFHDTPTFLRLCAEARTALRAAGVRRATALGAAHVGIELLLDGVWIGQAEVEDSYLGAVAHGSTLARTTLRWPSSAHATRFDELCQHLRIPTSARAYRSADEVGRRLFRILSARPALAPQPPDHAHLIAWARETKPAIERAAVQLVAELREHLHEAAVAAVR